MVNADQAHMPWVISKIDEAIYRVNPARIAASFEAITNLNKVLGSELSSIIVGFFAPAPGRLVVVQLLRSTTARTIGHSLLSASAAGARNSDS